jgi:ATP-binding cassette, subfamily C (CFTR/MRP), member 4
MECGSQSSFVGSKNPYKDASFLSKLSFWYTLDLFRRGSKKHFNQDDLYRPLKSDLSRVLGDRLEK